MEEAKRAIGVVPRSSLWKKLLDVGDDRFFVPAPTHISRQAPARGRSFSEWIVARKRECPTNKVLYLFPLNAVTAKSIEAQDRRRFEEHQRTIVQQAVAFLGAFFKPMRVNVLCIEAFSHEKQRMLKSGGMFQSINVLTVLQRSIPADAAAAVVLTTSAMKSPLMFSGNKAERAVPASIFYAKNFDSMQTCLQLTRHVLTSHLRLWPCYWFSCLLGAGDECTSSHLCPVCLRMLSAFTGALGNADVGLGQKQRQQTPYPVQRYKLLLQMFYRWKAFKQAQWIAERLMAVTGEYGGPLSRIVAECEEALGISIGKKGHAAVPASSAEEVLARVRDGDTNVSFGELMRVAKHDPKFSAIVPATAMNFREKRIKTLNNLVAVLRQHASATARTDLRADPERSTLPRRDHPPLPSAHYEQRYQPARHEAVRHHAAPRQRPCLSRPPDPDVYSRSTWPDRCSQTVIAGHSHPHTSATHNGLAGADVDWRGANQLRQNTTADCHFRRAQPPNVTAHGKTHAQHAQVNDRSTARSHPGALENQREALAIWEKVKNGGSAMFGELRKVEQALGYTLMPQHFESFKDRRMKALENLRRIIREHDRS